MEPAPQPLAFATPIPFVAHLGPQLRRFDGGQATLELALRPELTNAFGYAHGGVLMTLLDVAMAHAARSPEHEGGAARAPVMTVEMKTTFLRPGSGTLRAQGSVVHRTSSLVFCQARIVDVDDHAVAQATGTFKVFRERPGT